MNNKIFLVLSSILALVVFSSLASATLTIDSNTPISPVFLTANHSSDVAINVNLTADIAYPSISWSVSTADNGVTWTLTSLPTSINVGTQSNLIATLHIPQYLLVGTIVTAKLNVTDGTDSNQKEYQIRVNSNPSLSLTQIAPVEINKNGTIRVMNTGNTPSGIITLSSSDSTIVFTPSATISNIANGAYQDILVSSSATYSTMAGKSIAINASSSNAVATGTINFVESYCNKGNNGTLRITDISVNNKGDGEDYDWELFDRVEIEVEVENYGTESISSVYLEMKILDSTGKDVTKYFDLENDEINLGKLSDDSDDTATFVIPSVPVSSNLKDGNYQIYVKAYKKGSEATICTDTFNSATSQRVEISSQYSEGIVVDTSTIDVLESLCGSQAELTFSVYNVGDSKEESVLVTINNPELGVKQSKVISDLQDGDKETVSFTFNIPTNLTKKEYDLYISTFFDYDDGDVYEEDSYDQNSFDDLDEDFNVRLKVSQCNVAGQSQSQVAISASLKAGSVTKVGEDLIIEATVSNTGSSAKEFVITASDYDSWAKLVSIEPQVVTIAAGTSKIITIKLNPIESGTQTFNIKSIADGKTTTQLVQANIQEKSGFLTGSFLGSSGSTWVYVIIAAVIILILVLLIIIVRVASGSGNKSSDF